MKERMRDEEEQREVNLDWAGLNDTTSTGEITMFCLQWALPGSREPHCLS